MQKLYFLMLACLFVSSTFCQESNTNSKTFKPYASVGTTLSGGLYSFGGEFGMYQEKAWYAVGYSTVKGLGSDAERFHYASVKSYFKLGSQSIVDTYAYGGVNLGLTYDQPLYFEPGFAAVFNISNKFAPQLMITAPMDQQFKNPVLALGLSLNYWIK